MKNVQEIRLCKELFKELYFVNLLCKLLMLLLIEEDACKLVFWGVCLKNLSTHVAVNHSALGQFYLLIDILYLYIVI